MGTARDRDLGDVTRIGGRGGADPAEREERLSAGHLLVSYGFGYGCFGN